jgi:hypothetical protein
MGASSEVPSVIARLSPFPARAARNARLIDLRSGSPRETFDTPAMVSQPLRFIMPRVLRVTAGSAPEAMELTTGSATILQAGSPISPSTAIPRRIMATLSRGVSPRPRESMGNKRHASWRFNNSTRGAMFSGVACGEFKAPRRQLPEASSGTQATKGHGNRRAGGQLRKSLDTIRGYHLLQAEVVVRTVARTQFTRL